MLARIKFSALTSAWKPALLCPFNYLFSLVLFCSSIFSILFFPAAKFILLETTFWPSYSFVQNLLWPLFVGRTRKKKFLFYISRTSETSVLFTISKLVFPYTLYSLFSYPANMFSELCNAYLRPSKLLAI